MLCLCCLLGLSGLQKTEAQTLEFPYPPPAGSTTPTTNPFLAVGTTIAQTATATAGVSPTPTPEFVVVDGCPDPAPHVDDVTPAYAAQCSRCLEGFEARPQSQLQIPTRVVSSQTIGGGFVIGTATPTAWTPSPSPTATLTPSITPTASPTGGVKFLHVNFDDPTVLVWDIPGGNASVAAGVGADGTTGLRTSGDFDPAGNNYQGLAAIRVYVPTGITVQSWSMQAAYTIAGTANGINTFVRYKRVGHDITGFLGTSGNAGVYPSFPIRYFPTNNTLNLSDIEYVEFWLFVNASISAVAYLDNFTLQYLGSVATPTPTHTATPSPTGTLSPTPTQYWGLNTPAPGGLSGLVNCAEPQYRDKSPVVEMPELVQVGTTCIRVIPLIDIDFTSYSIPLVDLSNLPPVQVQPVDLCVAWQWIAPLKVFGLEVSWDLIFALPAVAFMIRRLYMF